MGESLYKGVMMFTQSTHKLKGVHADFDEKYNVF